MTPLDVKEWRESHAIDIDHGADVKPILNFEDAPFPPEIHALLKGYTEPTPIQSQGWPIALSGMDMVGQSRTGSGKTQAFLLPGLVHALAQPPRAYGEGPMLLCLAPTRELAVQIEAEARRFCHALNLHTGVFYGGTSRGLNLQAIRNGIDVLVGTPGRISDVLSDGALKFDRLTYVVLDEADRMLDMGFEPQIRRILGATRNDRQTLMWSATWPKEVNAIARDYMRKDYAHVCVGSRELTCNKDVYQVVEVIPAMRSREQRLTQLILKFKADQNRDGKFLVFCKTKKQVDSLSQALRAGGVYVAPLHGDHSQNYRDHTMAEFRRAPNAVLVATDVCGRGIDVDDIDVVVNFELPMQAEDYVHRVGRTGRAGRPGTSVSFVGPSDQMSVLRAIVGFM